MPTQIYRNVKDEIVPGNTNIIGTNLGWKTPGLVGWMRKSIMAQLCPKCALTVKDPNKLKDEAADAGTLAHAMIEANIKGKESLLPKEVPIDIWNKAAKAYENYVEWREQTNLKLITMEVPCISELYQFGTTVDIIALVAGKLSIVEVKTSNDVWPEMLIQVAAQVQAWQESGSSSLGFRNIEACHILKIGKEEATFSHHWFSPETLLPAFEAFKALRQLHDMKKVLSKLI